MRRVIGLDFIGRLLIIVAIFGIGISVGSGTFAQPWGLVISALAGMAAVASLRAVWEKDESPRWPRDPDPYHFAKMFDAELGRVQSGHATQHSIQRARHTWAAGAQAIADGEYAGYRWPTDIEEESHDQ